MRYNLYREQLLNTDINTAWTFFSSAKNLSKITPKEMNFRVLTDFNNDQIYEGMLIDYYVSPLLGIPLKWQTEIISVDYHKSFTDFQKKGPYKLWNHHHEFIETENGILMKDTVDYELPLGFLGNFAHSLIIKEKLEHIFDYRFNILEKMYNQ